MSSRSSSQKLNDDIEFVMPKSEKSKNNNSNKYSYVKSKVLKVNKVFVENALNNKSPKNNNLPQRKFYNTITNFKVFGDGKLQKLINVIN